MPMPVHSAAVGFGFTPLARSCVDCIDTTFPGLPDAYNCNGLYLDPGMEKPTMRAATAGAVGGEETRIKSTGITPPVNDKKNDAKPVIIHSTTISATTIHSAQEPNNIFNGTQIALSQPLELSPSPPKQLYNSEISLGLAAKSTSSLGLNPSSSSPPLPIPRLQYRRTEPYSFPTPAISPGPAPNPPHTNVSIYTQLSRRYSRFLDPCDAFLSVQDPDSNSSYRLQSFPPNRFSTPDWDRRFVSFIHRLKQRGMRCYRQFPVPTGNPPKPKSVSPTRQYIEGSPGFPKQELPSGFWACPYIPGGHNRRFIAFVSGKMTGRNWWSWIGMGDGETIFELPVGGQMRSFQSLELAAEHIAEGKPGTEGWEAHHPQLRINKRSRESSECGQELKRSRTTSSTPTQATSSPPTSSPLTSSAMISPHTWGVAFSEALDPAELYEGLGKYSIEHSAAANQEKDERVLAPSEVMLTSEWTNEVGGMGGGFWSVGAWPEDEWLSAIIVPPLSSYKEK